MTEQLILCDVDQTVADLHSEWLHRINQRYKLSLCKDDIKNWDMQQTHPALGPDVYDILREQDMYQFITPIPGSIDGVRELRRRGHRVVFVTACVPGTVDQKIEWLRGWDFLPLAQRVPHDFFAGYDKTLLAGDTLIDDAPHNAAGHPNSILVDAPYNQHLDHPRRAAEWSDIVAYVEEMAANRLHLTEPPQTGSRL